MLKQRIEQDLKTALLAGDKIRVNVLRSLKSAITYEEVALGVKGGAGLSDEGIIGALIRESKKRQESAEIFGNNNQQVRAEQELEEKKIIDNYLPPLVTEDNLRVLVDRFVNDVDKPGLQAMGQIIAKVKQEAETQGRADGAVIARLVKERLHG